MIFRFFKIGDILFSNIPPTNTTSSPSTIRTSSTTIILIINMRSTDLHPCIYSRLWLFQIRTAASGTEAENICLFRTSLSFKSCTKHCSPFVLSHIFFTKIILPRYSEWTKTMLILTATNTPPSQPPQQQSLQPVF